MRRFHEFELLMKELDPGLRSHFYGKMFAETLELADEMNGNGADDDGDDDVPVTADVWTRVRASPPTFPFPFCGSVDHRF